MLEQAKRPASALKGASAPSADAALRRPIDREIDPFGPQLAVPENKRPTNSEIASARPPPTWGSNDELETRQVAKQSVEADRVDPAGGRRMAAEQELSGRQLPVELAPMEFPHASQIRSALGVSDPLMALHDPEGCRGQGVPAFTQHTTAHFADKCPSLGVAAHEAAHVLQHRGRTRDGGLGAEGHAMAVESAMSSSGSAKALIGNHGAAVTSSTRGYVATEDGTYHVAETLEAATTGGKDAYATPGLIASAAAVLKAKGSDIELSAGGAKLIKMPDGTDIGLSHIDVKFPKVDPKSEEFWSDCREAGRSVAGAKPEDPNRVLLPGVGLDIPFQARVRDAPAFTAFLDEQIRKDVDYKKKTAAEKKEFATKAYGNFLKLSQKEVDEYAKRSLLIGRDKELGVDRFADAQPGEAFVSVAQTPPPDGRFYYHFATVIMATGPDRVTLENSGGDAGQKSTRWSIQMYGVPSPDNDRRRQTFHEAGHLAGGTPKRTVVARFMPPPPSDLATYPSLPTRDLLSRYEGSTDDSEKFYLKRELGTRRIEATVKVIETEDIIGHDDVFVVFQGALTTRTETQSLNDGESGTFTASLDGVLSSGGSITASFYDWDVEGHDFIGSASLAYPYASSTPVVSGDGATYNVTLSIT